jgi:hypothetical protein
MCQLLPRFLDQAPLPPCPCTRHSGSSSSRCSSQWLENRPTLWTGPKGSIGWPEAGMIRAPERSGVKLGLPHSTSLSLSLERAARPDDSVTESSVGNVTVLPRSQTLFGNAVRETPFRTFRPRLGRQRRNRVSPRRFPNRVWEPGRPGRVISNAGLSKLRPSGAGHKSAHGCDDLNYCRISRLRVLLQSLQSLQRCACRCKGCGRGRCNDFPQPRMAA